MSARELASRVRRLAEGLRARPDVDAARALAEQSQALLESVEQLPQLAGNGHDRRQLHQALERCTVILGELGGQLQDSMHRLSTSSRTLPAAFAAFDLLAAVVWRLTASCRLSASCSTLSRLGDEPSQDWQRLAASSYGVLHGGGLSLLEFSVAGFAATTTPNAGIGAAAPMLLAQLQAAAALARGMPLEQQLQAGLLQPAKLRAWLSAAVRMLQLLRRLGQPGWVQQPVLPALPELACTLYSCIELEPHWVFEQDGSTELLLVQLLMPALPALAVALRLPAERRPPGCTWEAAARLLKTLNLPPIKLSLEDWCTTADSRSLLGTLCATAQLLAMLSLEQPMAPAGSAAGSGAALGDALGSADPSWVVALDALMTLSWPVRTAAGQIGQHSTPEQRRVARDLLAVLARLPSLAKLVCGPSSATRGAQAVGTQLLIINTCCGIIQLLLGYAGRDTAAGTERPSTPPQLVSSRRDAAAWCSAASTDLRSIPALAEWQVPAVDLVHGLVELASWAGQATTFLVGAQFRAGDSITTAGAAEDTALLLDAVRDLHTRSARLVHLAASEGSSAARCMDRQAWESLLSTLFASMTSAFMLSEAQARAAGLPVGQGHTNRQLEAMAVCHLPAVQVLARALSFSALNAHCHLTVASSLSASAGRGPSALGASPGLQRFLQEMLQDPATTLGDCQILLRACAPAPLVVAHLLLGPHTQAALLRGLKAHGDITPGLVSAAVCAVGGVVSAARQAGGEQHELDDLSTSLDQLVILANQGHEADALCQMATELLPQAAPAAAAVVQHLTPSPEAAQLELAQAAAARSCAYLCCANPGGEGGPAAGQGAGSQRCSACRAVWYCSTTCSHADWRAGHRHVCKALGAARAAEKERRRQQAAGEGRA